MSEVAGTALILLGALALAIACWGVLRLPDALSRQHAATKAATLALAAIALGTATLHGGSGWWLRALLLLALLALTLPLASHALARAAIARDTTSCEAGYDAGEDRNTTARPDSR